ncbi:hypothetical protein KKB64_05350 [Patescibacteria group bacterium]|nr:hypothetical protein [Patescibacteria group bacterium]MBU1473176.1 hypothetical protein [Patescibacteria group bacterium]MBU2544286.1 hypothetical protein [Patescibacteria group bacterium]
MNQTQVLKKLGGEKRLEQAFKLSSFVRELSLRNIQLLYPHLSKKDQLMKLQERMRYG